MVTHVDVDVQQLWKDYRVEPTVELRNQLVELYLPLVKYNAERIWARLPDGVDLDDLISAGVFGLMDAIDAFDLDRGVKFEEARKSLEAALGRPPRPDEMAVKMGLTLEEFEKMIGDATAVGLVSLN